MKKLLLLLLCTCMQAAFAQSGKIDWKADLEFLTKELPEKHCNFFTARSKGEFVSGIEAIKAESKRLTDFQVALKTQQLIARFGDSHTMLQFFQLIDQTQILPLGTLWVSDGLYITKTTPENKEILGLRIVAINDTPIATVIDSLSTLFTIDNQAIVKSIVPETVMSLQALEHFGFADSRQVKLMLSDGKTQVVKPIHPDNAFVNFRPDSLAFATANRKVLFTSRYFPEDRIYYMLYNKCHSRELAAERGDAEAAQKLPSFEAFTRKAFETLNDKPVDKLIFDMRYNGGGNSSQGTEFVERLAQALKQHPQVAVYVVLGRDTFSSAILNAMDFKQLTNANPVLLEPIYHVEVDVPDQYMGDILGDLNKRRGRVMGMTPTGNGEQVIEAECPEAELMSYAIDLRSMTQSRGSFVMHFVRYEQCSADAQAKAVAAAKAMQETE